MGALVLINFKDGDANTRIGVFYSNTGNTSGQLSPVHGIMNSNGAMITVATADQLPATLGTKFANGSLSVSIANNDTILSTLSAIQGSANDTSTINMTYDISIVKDGNTSVTPRRIQFTANTSGNNTILAANTTKAFQVLQVSIMTNANVDAAFLHGANGAPLLGKKYLPERGAGIVLPFSLVGWAKTAANSAIVLNLSAGVEVSGEIVVAEVS